MKKLIAVLLLIGTTLSIITAFPVSASADAEAVSTAAEFAAMKPDGNYYLASDITLEGSYEHEFTGHFNGNGKTLTISTAMFTTVNNATIENFTVNGNIGMKSAGYTLENNDFAAAVAIVANGASAFKNIISNVSFSTKSPNTRYGSIAATSAEDHALVIENCINNGKITVIKYAGGIYGWTPKLGNSAVRNCINNGEITAEGYCGGIIARLGLHTGSMTIENCINNGDITSKTSYCGGIYGYSNTITRVTRCINTGDITGASGDIGGIGCCVAQNNAVGDSFFQYNINYGNVTNRGTGKTGGILGYVYGTGSSFAVMIGNINFGKITGKSYTSQLIAYTNSDDTVIMYNIGAGSVSGSSKYKALFVGLSSADINAYKASHNYFVEDDGTKNYSYADNDKYASNRIALEDRPEGALTFISPDKLGTAEIAELLNYELAADVFEVRDGKTVIKCKHAYAEAEIYAEIPATCKETGRTAGYKCSACSEVLGCEELSARGHSYESGKCTLCGEADPTVTEAVTEAETTAPATEPASPNILPMIIAATAFAVIIVAAAVFAVMRKKK